jgi:glucosamine--fructose-6-phosphate aminotransferase (isomerizing)
LCSVCDGTDRLQHFMCGIGHTRWATQGKPEKRNAHPQLDGPGWVAVVQNGIIENYRTLREQLQAEGWCSAPRRIRGDPPPPRRELGRLQAVQAALSRLHGAYALAVVWAKTPGALVVARKAALLMIGLGEGEFFCASDTPPLAGFTRTILPLKDAEVALLTPLGIELYDAAGERVQRTPSLLSGTEYVADMRSFKHFMLKVGLPWFRGQVSGLHGCECKGVDELLLIVDRAEVANR